MSEIIKATRKVICLFCRDEMIEGHRPGVCRAEIEAAERMEQ